MLLGNREVPRDLDLLVLPAFRKTCFATEIAENVGGLVDGNGAWFHSQLGPRTSRHRSNLVDQQSEGLASSPTLGVQSRRCIRTTVLSEGLLLLFLHLALFRFTRSFHPRNWMTPHLLTVGGSTSRRRLRSRVFWQVLRRQGR